MQDSRELAAGLRVEKRTLEEALRLAEQSLAGERSAARAQQEMAESRLREILRQKENTVGERSSALEQLAAAKAEKVTRTQHSFWTYTLPWLAPKQGFGPQTGVKGSRTILACELWQRSFQKWPSWRR